MHTPQTVLHEQPVITLTRTEYLAGGLSMGDLLRQADVRITDESGKVELALLLQTRHVASGCHADSSSHS